MSYRYLELQFEGINNTDDLFIKLEDVHEYEHITGNCCSFVGYTSIKSDKDFKQLKSKIIDAVHSLNDGSWAEVNEVTEQQIEHLL